MNTTRVPIPCLTCGVLTSTPRKGYCIKCDALHKAVYRDPVYRAIPLVGQCVRCAKTGDLTRDHIIPIKEGGTNLPSNIQILCRRCNSRKGSKA